MTVEALLSPGSYSLSSAVLQIDGTPLLHLPQSPFQREVLLHLPVFLSVA